MFMESGDFLCEQSRAADPVMAAVADNCRFEERTSMARWQQFREILAGLPGGLTAFGWPDWAEAYKLYFEQYCDVPRFSVPDAFLKVNEPAWLPATADNQAVIRLEILKRPLDANRLSLEGLETILKRSDSGKDGDAQRTVEDFFRIWNERRYSRPMFVAFYDEVKAEVEADDWPHAIRDRLGMGHCGLTDGSPLPVALMKYPLTDAFDAQRVQRLPVSCALPTVLDGGMHEFFFPVPREHPYGATLHLAPGLAETLTAELLHCRFDYTRKHLLKWGWIRRSHECSGEALRDARDLHLLALQVECDRADFGEPMKGRQ